MAVTKKATAAAKKPTTPAKRNANVGGKALPQLSELFGKTPSSPTETTEHKNKVKKTLAKSVQSSRDEDQQRTTKKATPAPTAPITSPAGKDVGEPNKRGSKTFRTAEAARKSTAGPGEKAKARQDHQNRIAVALENDLVTIEPQNDEVQVKLTDEVEEEPISAVKEEGLMDHLIGDGPYRILLPVNPTSELTLSQRVAMAKNIQELHGKLPYIKTIALRKPDFYNAEAEAKKQAANPVAKDRAPSNKTTSSAASTIPNGVPLKKICADINIDPKIARRILRAKGKKPGGRWEWPQAEVEATKKLIKDEAAKLAGKE